LTWNIIYKFFIGLLPMRVLHLNKRKATSSILQGFYVICIWVLLLICSYFKDTTDYAGVNMDNAWNIIRNKHIAGTHVFGGSFTVRKEFLPDITGCP